MNILPYVVVERAPVLRTPRLITYAVALVATTCALATIARAQSYNYLVNDSVEAGALTTPWHIENKAYDTANVTVQTGIARHGNFAARLVNKITDPGEAVKRTEMTVGTANNLIWGQEYWIGYSFYLKDWVNSAYGEMVSQFHGVPAGQDWSKPSGRNLFDIHVQNGMTAFNTITEPRAAAGGAMGDTVWMGRTLQNTWNDCVLHVRPSTGADGLTEIWYRGRLIYQQTGPNVDSVDNTGALLYPAHYMKCGVYNWPWGQGNYDVTQREIIYDEVKIGHVGGGYTGGYAGVAPGGLAMLPAAGATPSTLVASWTSSNQVKLDWLDTCGNETGFKIERRSSSGGAYTQIATVGAGVTTYIDSAPALDVTHYYRVRAYNGAYNSAYSLEATARKENFVNGAADFAVVHGTWNASTSAYKVTANGTDALQASLSLLDTPVAGNFILKADGKILPTSSSWDNFEIVFGYQDAQNHYVLNAAESQNGMWNRLYKVVNGTTVHIKSFSQTFTPGVAYSMAIQRIGDSIVVYRDGELVASVRDTTFLYGRVGFGTKFLTTGPKLAEFSNVTLTQGDISGLQEDFSAGAARFNVAQGSWALDGGKYAVTANGVNARAASLSLWETPVSGDFTVSADCQMVPTTSSWDNMNIVFNYQDANNYYHANFAEGDNGVWNGIFKVVNGVATQIANIATVYTADTLYGLRVQKVGNTISVYENNVLRASVTDSTFTGGKIGLGTSMPTSGPKLARFDNVVVSTP